MNINTDENAKNNNNSSSELKEFGLAMCEHQLHSNTVYMQTDHMVARCRGAGPMTRSKSHDYTQMFIKFGRGTK